MRASRYAIAAWFVLVAVFVLLAVISVNATPLPGEVALIDAAQEFEQAGDVARFFRDPAHDWNPLALLVLAGIALWKGYPGLAIAIVLLWPARLLNAYAKVIVDSPRPGADFAVDSIPASNAYPSGHAFTAAILAIALVAVCYRLGGRRAALVAAVPAIAFVALAGFARLWLGVHWPADVVGGVLLAAIVAMALFALEPAFNALVRSIPLIGERRTRERGR